MFNYFHKHAYGVLFLVSGLILTACGGGDVPGLPGGNNPSLAISSTTMELSAFRNGATPTSPIITLTASGGTVYVDSDSTINGIYGHGLYCTNTTTCTIEVQPRPPSSLNVGTYIDTINVRGCTDNACNSVFVTYQITVTYRILEGGNFTVNPTSLSFDSVETIAAPSQNINVSYTGGVATSWSATIDYNNGSNWLILTPSNGSTASPTDVTVSTQGLPPGTYTATININSNGGTVTTSVPVTYTVIAGRTNPITLNYSVDPSTQASDLQQGLTVLSSFAGTNPSADWSISSDVSWLQFSQLTGDTLSQNQVTVTVDNTQISTLRNGTHTATITLGSSTAGVSDWTVPVTLVVNLPQVNYVAPYTSLAGVAGQVIVRGSGFAGITSENVMFGTNAATSMNVISDTEMLVGHEALVTGVYPVMIANQLNAAISQGDLHVIDPVSFPEAVINTAAGTKTRLVYDAQRQTLYAAGAELQRYRYIGSSWQTDSIAITNLNDIAMTPDGRELIAIGSPTAALGDTTLYHVDLATFAIIDTVPFNTRDFSTSTTFYIGSSVDSLAMANDGHVIIGSANLQAVYLKYNVQDQTFQLLDASGNGATTRPALAGSADGSTIYMAGGNGPQAQAIFRYTASGNGSIYSNSAYDSTREVATGLTGSRLLVDRSVVYDSQLNNQGEIARPAGATLSSDGDTAICFLSVFSAPDVIRRYDLTSPDGSGGFNTIGADITLVSDPTQGVVTPMTLTPSNQNVFIGGNGTIHIVPLP